MPTALRFIVLTVSFACLLVTPRASWAQCTDWSGAFGPAPAGTDGVVRAIEIFDDGSGEALYAAGDFGSAGGVVVRGIAKWDGTAWSALGTGIDFGGWASALAVYDDGGGTGLYMAGSFTSVSGVPAFNIARWRSGAWTAVGGGLQGVASNNTSVAALEVHEGELWAGGAFRRAGGQTTDRIAAWDGAAWTTFTGAFTGEVRVLHSAVIAGQSRLFAGGYFASAGVADTRYLAQWDGAAWSGVGASDISGTGVLALGSAGTPTSLFIGGDFSNVANVARQNIARWTGSAWATVTGLNSPVDALRGSGNLLYATGRFNATGLSRIGVWNGSTWTGLGQGLTPTTGNDGGLCLRIPNSGKVYVGGGLTHAGGQPSRNIGLWGVPCAAPAIIQHPASQTAVLGSPGIFTVQASGSAPLTYQWRHNGLPLSEAPPQYQGVGTATLTINAWNLAQGGDYDCVVTNSQGSATSNVAVFTVPTGVPGGPVALTKVVQTPQTLAGESSLPINLLSEYAVSPDGSVGILGQRSGGQFIGMAWDGAVLTRAAECQQAAPGLPMTEFACSGTFRDFDTGLGHAFSFSGDLGGSGAGSAPENRALWHGSPAVSTLVARGGMQAPGLPTNVTFSGSSSIFNLIRARTADGVVFSSFASGPSFPARFGLWSWSAGSGTSLVARIGGTAPILGGTLTSLEQIPEQNSAGTIAFRGTVAGEQIIWRGPPGSPEVVFRGSDPAPSYPAGTTYAQFDFNSYILAEGGDIYAGPYVHLSNGQDRFALYHAGDEGAERIAAEGDAAPDTSLPVFFRQMHPWDASGETCACFVDLTGNGCTNGCPGNGLWVWRSGVWHLVIMVQPYRPSFLPSTVDVLNIMNAGVSPDGYVILTVQLRVAGNQYTSVMGWEESTGLFPIAIPGYQMETEPGVYRTVQSATLTGEPIPAGLGARARAFTDQGLAYFMITFTDQVRGIYSASFGSLLRAAVPCPPDFNSDIEVNSNDVADFLNTWFADQGPGTLHADYNHDGETNSNDVTEFLNDWFAAIAAGGC